MKNLSILIADDHPIFRKGLINILKHKFPYTHSFFEAGNGVEVLEILEKVEIDIVFLDIDMPLMNGVETLREMRKSWAELPVIVISMFTDFKYVKEMYDQRVNAYLFKNTNGDELQKCITLALDGHSYFSPGIANSLYKNLLKETEIKTSLVEITPREREVLLRICKEMTEKEIAFELNIAHTTVKTHRINLYEKTNTKTGIGLVLFAIKNGIFKLP